MKRIISGLLIFAFCAVVISCGDNPSGPDETVTIEEITGTWIYSANALVDLGAGRCFEGTSIITNYISETNIITKTRATIITYSNDVTNINSTNYAYVTLLPYDFNETEQYTYYLATSFMLMSNGVDWVTNHDAISNIGKIKWADLTENSVTIYTATNGTEASNNIYAVTNYYEKKQ
jgi:hypothetical protein